MCSSAAEDTTMCTSQEHDVLNALHLPDSADDKTAIIALCYSPYMN